MKQISIIIFILFNSLSNVWSDPVVYITEEGSKIYDFSTYGDETRCVTFYNNIEGTWTNIKANVDSWILVYEPFIKSLFDSKYIIIEFGKEKMKIYNDTEIPDIDIFIEIFLNAQLPFNLYAFEISPPDRINSDKSLLSRH